jgi:hypothetical protein
MKRSENLDHFFSRAMDFGWTEKPAGVLFRQVFISVFDTMFLIKITAFSKY